MIRDFFSSLFSHTAYAWSISGTGLDTAAGSIFQKTATVEVIAGRAIQAALAIIGVVFLVLIVYAGILWMTAQGEEKKVGTARGYIFHSILGLIIVMAAYSLTEYIVRALATAALN